MNKLIKEPAIIVSNVTKSFKIPIEPASGMKQKLINTLKRRKGYRDFMPLNDVSFTVEEGDFFGIVGRNGSGKSTLLKTIAGIYNPNSGGVSVNGKLVPFIELGVGFNPELTGRENIFLNGALLGFSRDEIRLMYDDIVDFAELRDFMEESLKNYSSGMQVRLAFSIAIRARGDILLLDEVLAVGDEAFQQKCYNYFTRLKEEHRTIILVTHSMDIVKRFCDRALLLDAGKVKSIGSPDEIARQYTLDNFNSETKDVDPSVETETKTLNEDVKSLDVKFKSKKMLSPSSVLEFSVDYILNKDIDVDIGISIIYQNISIIEHNTQDIKLKNGTEKLHSISYSLPLENLNPGRYGITAAIFEKKDFKLIGFTPNSFSFIIEDRGKKPGGILSKHGEWTTVI
jgi:ABC-2 type transport system ATP-binding protein